MLRALSGMYIVAVDINPGSPDNDIGGYDGIFSRDRRHGMQHCGRATISL